MQFRTISGLGASSASELQSLIAGLDVWMGLLSRVAPSQRNLSIVADDSTVEGALFSPAAFAVIRGGSAEHFPVGNVMAFDGRKVRAFSPVWDAVVAELALAGSDRVRPVAEVTSRDIADSFQRIDSARKALVARIPTPTAAQPIAQKNSSNWLLWAVGIVVVGGVAYKAKKA